MSAAASRPAGQGNQKRSKSSSSSHDPRLFSNGIRGCEFKLASDHGSVLLSRKVQGFGGMPEGDALRTRVHYPERNTHCKPLIRTTIKENVCSNPTRPLSCLTAASTNSSTSITPIKSSRPVAIPVPASVPPSHRTRSLPAKRFGPLFRWVTYHTPFANWPVGCSIDPHCTAQTQGTTASVGE